MIISATKEFRLGTLMIQPRTKKKIEDQPNKFVNSTNSVHYELRNINIQRVVSSNEEKQNKAQNPTNLDKT